MAFDMNTWGQQYGLTDAQKASLQAVMGSDDFVQKTRAYNMMYGSDNADANRALDAAKQLGILNQTLSGAGASPSGGAGQTYGTWNVANTGSAGSLDATPWGTTGAPPRGVMNTPTGVTARLNYDKPLKYDAAAPSWEEMLGRFGQPTARLPAGSFAPGAGYGMEGALSGLGSRMFAGGTPGFNMNPQGRALGYGALPQMLAQRQRPGYQAPAGSTPYGYGALSSLFGPGVRPTPVGDTRYRGALKPPQPIGQPVTYQNGGGYRGTPAATPGMTFGQPNPFGATPLGAGGFGIRTLGG